MVGPRLGFSRGWAGRMRRATTAALALLTLALAACDDGSDGAARAQQPAAAPPSVTVATPLVRKLTEWDEYTGRYEPVQQVEIHARVAGYLQEIGFKDGDTVEQGQVLFAIDPRPYEATADQARAQVEQGQAQLRLAELEH